MQGNTDFMLRIAPDPDRVSRHTSHLVSHRSPRNTADRQPPLPRHARIHHRISRHFDRRMLAFRDTECRKRGRGIEVNPKV